MTTASAIAALLPGVASGDPAAIRAVIERYGGLLWSIARRFEPADAEDAVQEIFVEIWRSAGRYDPKMASEATFLAMIARRRLIDRRRRAARRPNGEPSELSAMIAPGAGPDVAAEAALAARALDQLRPEQRQVVLLAVCYGMSHSEIAESTGLPLGTVKAHARRGLQAIRTALSIVTDEDIP